MIFFTIYQIITIRMAATSQVKLWWYSNGQLCIKTNFVEGKQHGLREEWDMNGQLMIKENFVEGKRHGLREAWHDDGQLWYKENWVNSERHGLREVWYHPEEGGQLEIKENFVQGELYGLSEEWYENGQLKSRKYYIEGKEVPETEYLRIHFLCRKVLVQLRKRNTSRREHLSALLSQINSRPEGMVGYEGGSLREWDKGGIFYQEALMEFEKLVK